MMIGEHFKRVRNSKNLTQEQMAAGIVNRSFYSRVENGSSSITADNLMKILYKHGLAMTEFLRDFDTSESNIETYQDKITVAYINKDILALKDIYLHFKYEDVRTKRLLKFLIAELNATATRKQFKKLSYIFFKQNKWDEETLWLIFHIMDWYEMSDLRDLIDTVIKKFNYKNSTERMKQLMIRIAIRYLAICFKRDKDDSKAQDIINRLKSLPNTADMRLYKIITVYYDKLFSHKYDEASDIANILNNI